MSEPAALPRRFLVPEVIQTSAMDCGPASLKCLLEGFGVPVSYGRLREACQTDVDGTSIDTMEGIARQLGVEVEQLVLPADLLLLPEAHALPSIVVVRKPNGSTHFIVVWACHGRWVQVMDPAAGRRWLDREQLLADIYNHTLAVPAGLWADWFRAELRPALARRLRNLGLPEGGRALLEAACDAAGWRSLATLDAATRLVTSLVRAGGIAAGPQATRVLEDVLRRAGQDEEVIAPAYWWARPAGPGPEGEEQVALRGAVLLHATGRAPTDAPQPGEAVDATPPPLSQELAAALGEPPASPGRELLRLLLAGGRLPPLLLLCGLLLLGSASMLEALLFRGFIDLGRDLRGAEQRLVAFGALFLFLALLILMELPLVGGGLRLGRHLEARLRMAFLAKLPRLGDRYFQSRPTSDMTERLHSVYLVRLLPVVGSRAVQTLAELLVMGTGLVWLDPGGLPLALVSTLVVLALPLAIQVPLSERDMQVRSHMGALSRSYLEAMLGLVAVRTHGAERVLRREHDSLLLRWGQSSRALLKLTVSAEAFQGAVGFGIAAWLLLEHLGRTRDTAGVLLFSYWALSIPLAAQELGMMLRQFPSFRNVTLRLMEPLGAPEEPGAAASSVAAAAPAAARAVGVEFQGVGVVASGHRILEPFDLRLRPGEHVAIVGPSGAGKSSLLGLLLGWHRPASGTLRVDGQTLDAGGLVRLRQQTAWVDPAVQLWNRSFLENLAYGSPGEDVRPGPLMDAAALHPVLEGLPQGLRSPLGEGGGFLSGGEGQRVRLGRAMARANARLVLLDEPFRGLDRAQRRGLLQRARTLWREATLVCVTHDLEETLEFGRVLVVDGGRIVEDGVPSELAAREGSRYRALLDAEAQVRTRLWASARWRRLVLREGRLLESPREAEEAQLPQAVPGKNVAA
jgi:ATP-binding cassette subfamily B protein